ncbi:phage holin family protein [Citricoccus sp. K5]|uniref:phage holin family protein n=1 Tax=Citricoccus sp. K5 TaxID=2653135 RepID=UPI0012F1E991|nr:phage holin family protein [Citricoccus sp. K5]VXC01390.1 conserved membrane hypothetical protein [Citricoccus sp. K5]
MIRFLIHAVINLVMAAVGLLLAGALIDGVSMQPSGFITAVLVFVLAQALLAPFVFNLARQYASAVLGGVGLVSTLLALWIATLMPNGLTMDGVSAWVLAPLVVWLVTALGTWVAGYFLVTRWWDRRTDRAAIRKAVA